MGGWVKCHSGKAPQRKPCIALRAFADDAALVKCPKTQRLETQVVPRGPVVTESFRPSL